MSRNFLQTIVSHGSKYMGASVVGAGTTLLMTKYYTSVFNPSEFGILALYLVMLKYVSTLSGLTLDSTSTRLYFDYKKSKRDEYLSTIFWFISIIASIVFILGLLLKNTVSNWIVSDSLDIYLITLFTGISAMYVSFLTRVLYNEQKSSSVLRHTLFQTFVNHLSSVVFISIFNLGILGRMSGQGLGYFFNISYLFKEFSKENLFRLKIQFNKAMAGETFILALPTIVASLQTVGFVYLDRIFLKHYIGDSAVGIYTLGYMLGQGLSMVYEAISQAILPKVFNDMNENYAKAIEELEDFSYKYYFGLLVITIVISVLSPAIVSLFSNENYSEAAAVMPFVMAGFMMGGFYKIPSLVLGYHKIVWFYPFVAFVSFGSNALLNWYLIPIYGMIGAAFASFIGVFIYSSIMQYMSRKYFSLKYNVFVLIVYVLILLISLGWVYGQDISFR